MNLQELNNTFFRVASLIFFVFSFFSCSNVSDRVNITYEIKEYRDSRFDVNFTINNTSSIDLNSPWSLHWNQQSSIIDEQSVPENVIYNYVAGQYYNILTFGKDYILDKDSSFSIDLSQRGIVRRQSDLPVGGFIVSNDDIIDVEFDYVWKNAKGIEKLNAPTSVDRYNEYISNSLLDKSDLDYIIPTPSNFIINDGEVEILNNYSIVIDQNFNLSEQLINSVFDGIVNIDFDHTNEVISRITVDLDESINAESYQLSISDGGISIRSADRAGALYALQSLKQIFLISKLENTPLKFIEINDSPKFSYRGMLLDISRNFYGPDKIKQIIDYLSFFKINYLDFRLTDDEGWRLEIPGLEELVEVGSKRAYTKDEFENLIPMYGSGPDTNSTGSGYLSRSDYVDILKYASERNISVIPQISVPSHMRSAIVSMNARYQKYMEMGNQVEAEKYLLIDPDDKSEYYSAQGFTDNIMNICRESSFTFYEKVIDEIYLMYKDAGIEMAKFGVAADELPYGAWQKSPMCDKFMSENSISGDYNALYELMQRRIYNKISSYGATMTGWDDILLKLTEKNQSETQIKDFFKDDDILLFVWKNDWGEGRQDMIYKYANLGYKTIMSNSSAFYFDMVDDKDLDNIGLSWSGYANYKDMWTVDVFDVFNDLYGVEKNNISREYIENSVKLDEDKKDNIIGVQSQIWSETIRNEGILDYMFMPNIIVFSQKAWSHENSWMDISNNDSKREKIENEWNKFANNIGQRVLPMVDNIFGGLAYDLPKPGGIVANDTLYANTVFPGLNIKYTLDGSNPEFSSETFTSPIKINEGDIINLRLFDNTGRGGNSIIVETKYE
ncbi:MAG: family 20 glycosylhydrolase [Bacteroidota bacterium]|nr:family 20 glycosylhydrolase [Bacteroidota bacterium]